MLNIALMPLITSLLLRGEITFFCIRQRQALYRDRRPDFNAIACASTNDGGGKFSVFRFFFPPKKFFFFPLTARYILGQSKGLFAGFSDCLQIRF